MDHHRHDAGTFRSAIPSTPARHFPFCLPVLAAALAACGGSPPTFSTQDGGLVKEIEDMDLDSGARPEMEAGAPPDARGGGAPSTTYPAFKVDAPQIVNSGGPILAAPVIVTVTWSIDPDAATWNALDDDIGSSAYWHAINSEYGVGPASSGAENHVTLTTMPSGKMDDSDLQSLLAKHAGVDWPKPTPNTVYTFYLPPATTLYLDQSDACRQGTGGYHSATRGNPAIPYAVLPHCATFKTEDIEYAAAHELNEAATDPYPVDAFAWNGVDSSHLGFAFLNSFQLELGDACEFFADSTDAVDFKPYTVQRQWSNKSAAAGSHWCVPALDEPFYNTTFLQDGADGGPTTQFDQLAVDLSSLGVSTGTVRVAGFKVRLAEPRTFPIGYFSDRATPGPISLDVAWPSKRTLATDRKGRTIQNGAATVTIDKDSGLNGEIANVTVTPTAYGTLGVTMFVIRAGLAGSKRHHYLPILLGRE
jgi:hypothetical protein